jgi:KUP system potassium uptake protein
MDSLEARKIPRVPGTAIFLTRTLNDTPPGVVWHVKHNRALHDHLFVLRVVTKSIPRIKQSERLATIEVATNFWRATARYGFMERPDVRRSRSDWRRGLAESTICSQRKPRSFRFI